MTVLRCEVRTRLGAICARRPPDRTSRRGRHSWILGDDRRPGPDAADQARRRRLYLITYSSPPRLNVLPLPPTRNSSLMTFGLAPSVNAIPDSFPPIRWLFHAPSKSPATSG